MTNDRIDQIESVLLRAACDQPLDGRQRYIKLGLELVEGLRRSKELEVGASSKAEEIRRWYAGAKELLQDAVTILGMVPQAADAIQPGWTALKNRFLRKVADQ